MKTVVVLIALLFLSSPAYAWTKADSQRQLVYTVGTDEKLCNTWWLLWNQSDSWKESINSGSGYLFCRHPCRAYACVILSPA